MCALVLLSAGVLGGASAQAGPSVTVYSRDLAFVRESRTFDLGGNRDVVRLEGVSKRLDFSSVRLAPSSGRLTRLAYRYDVASGDALFERAIGSRVRLNLRDNRVAEGVLFAAEGEWLVLQGDDGALANVRRDAVNEARLAGLGAGLSLKPSIEGVIEGARRGAGTGELSYLTGGLSWSAEHLLVRTGERTATWTTAVNVDNQCGREFTDAKLKLVAGEPSRSGGGMPPPQPMAMRAMAMADGMAEAKVSEESFADYHLYTVDKPVTLRDRETQSFTLIETREIAVKPRYLYRGGDPRGVASQLQIVNEAKGGVGAPIPGGRVRFFEADGAKDLQFTGETSIAHTPLDEKRTLDVGYAFDLQAERKETSNRQVSDREREYSIELRLRNRKATDVTIVVEEPAGGEVSLVKQSHPSTRKDSHTFQFDLAVPAGKEVVLTYTARQRW